jgi:hypothetical protein
MVDSSVRLGLAMAMLKTLVEKADPNETHDPAYLAKFAVALTDALLKELE